MNSLDLFSCIGCHALGFERAGIQTKALCEVNPWRRERLREQFPSNIEIHDDIRKLPAVKADIVFGGPPCQATSVAAAISGKRTGDSLWRYMLKTGIDAEAKWIVVEQPPGNKEWQGAVQNDLAQSGYHVAFVSFAASDIGAPYLRRRDYTLACTSLPRLEVAWQAIPSEIEYVKRTAHARADWDASILATIPVDARSAGDMDRGARSKYRKEAILALGDSNPPGMAEVIGRAIMQTNYT